MVAPANAGPLFFITRADSPLKAVSDLRGRRVCVGPAKSGMAQHADTMFRALGFEAGDVTVINLDVAQGAQALRAGEVDAQLQCPIPNRVMSALDQDTDLRILEWGDDLARVLAFQPLYRPTRLLPGQLRCVAHETAQPAVANVIVTHARADAAMVKSVVAAIIENATALTQLEPLYTGLPDLFEPLRTQGASAFEFSGVPLHEGAKAACRAAGLLA
jgi:TRAP transporter TAXI family solute receptor